MSQDLKIPQSELNKISEYVTRGIAASKASDSHFWGKAQDHFRTVDERLEGIEKSVNGLLDQVKIANGRTRKLEDLQLTSTLILNSNVADIANMKENTVTRETFSPIQKIVYGLIGVFGVAVCGAILKLILIPS